MKGRQERRKDARRIKRKRKAGVGHRREFSQKLLSQLMLVEDEVIEKFREGGSNQAIASWLREEKLVDLTPEMVDRFLGFLRNEGKLKRPQ